MKPTILLAALAVSGAAGHTIMQKISVNGADQGQLKGVRAPDSDSPIMNVNDANFACNTCIKYKDNTVINVPAGAKVGGWWGHVIGGAQGSNDPDNPIAASHKGPVIYYLAKVDDAATTGTTGLKWFKIGEEGRSNGNAGSNGQAQFYMECAQINITGSGTKSSTNTVSFPGAYKSSDPGILINIYNNSGQPNGGGRAYTVPGPQVFTC
ncbi:hypothetical protein GLAREA_09967 [Glarea lozoyensis ATCC 20868]|uniref:AA9 family lytic polysaccharide monooxygenase n=1 Tax=Glarea lozoyensis (strain ATCC 20868 / MF5171) TaxID=1116229 RepID=S3E7I9_GLAL2|nr:uncharacterized protein GLAREA_09967 [Glarea lozoyensis ATCC 20868]EPE34273.1 hypothetical protein GLAREA_09967 [Glarea lozoyensis ATCC 20868]